MLICHLCFLFYEVSVQIILKLDLKKILILVFIELCGIPCIYWMQILCHIYVLYFSLSLWLV